MSWVNRKFFVQEIKDFDKPLLRKMKEIYNYLLIKFRDFRCNFFRVLFGGELPLHTDVLSKSSVVIPITEMTGPYTLMMARKCYIKT